MSRRRVAALVTAGLLAASAPVAVAAPAEAAKGCATKADYRKVAQGQTRAKVAKRLHQKGRLTTYHMVKDATGQWRLVMVYRYRMCSGRYVGVTFREDPALERYDGIVLTVKRKWRI